MKIYRSPDEDRTVPNDVELGPPYRLLNEEETAAWVAAQPVSVPVAEEPARVESVTPLQMRRALNHSGLRSSVEAAVAAADQDTKDAWDFALEIRRDNPLLVGMAAQLGMTAQQLDDLFALAATFQ